MTGTGGSPNSVAIIPMHDDHVYNVHLAVGDRLTGDGTLEHLVTMTGGWLCSDPIFSGKEVVEVCEIGDVMASGSSLFNIQ